MSDQDSDQSQPNPVADNADAEVLPQTGKPSQAEGEDPGVRDEETAGEQ